MKKIIPSLFLLLFCTHIVVAQGQQSTYNHQKAFSPLFFADGGNLFRSINGTPGPRYWQNSANYAVTAELDTTSKMLTGEVIIDYTNNSPGALHQLWLQLVWNAADSVIQPNAGPSFTLHEVKINHGYQWINKGYTIYGNKMQIKLDEPLEGKGNSIKIAIKYELKLPPRGRSSYVTTKNGSIFDVAYWYPRMFVYDDIKGWNTYTFLGGGEFYLDYGTIDYKITVPDEMLVAASGKLLNPEEVLTQTQRDRLAKAWKSEETIMIRTKDELDEPATQIAEDGTLTWHFRMEHTRDVAWATSTAFIWDAATATLQNGEKTIAMSYFPVESSEPDEWGRGTQYLKYALEYFSHQWINYPYSKAVSVAGPTGGMEYPGITFDSWKATGYTTFLLVVHEIGHNWFPMLIGSSERLHAWMDEGFNTFIDIYAHKHFNNGEFAPKRDGEYAPGGGNPADEVVAVITNKDAQPIVSRADAVSGAYLHPLAYFKTAFGLVLLREIVLGHDRFDYAFRQYMKAWSFKHPGPKDFFRAMNNFSGENLNWFWRGWFLNNWQLDQAVTKVEHVKNRFREGTAITIKNLKKMPMPVLLTVKTSNGETRQYKLPVTVWMKGSEYTFIPAVEGDITEVILDADHRLPDVDRSNNTWTN